MAVRIDRNRCNGCGILPEPRCTLVCPGDLLYRDHENRCQIREIRDCWDCASCIKECPRQAIEMYLPAEIGGRGATLKASSGRDSIHWVLTAPDGQLQKIEIRTRTKPKEG